MYLPNLIPYNVKKVTIGEFHGINKGKLCAENEFSDTLDLCSKEYPLLSSLSNRYRLTFPEISASEVGIFDNEGIGIIYGDNGEFKLNYKGEDISSFEYNGAIAPSNILNFNSETFFIGGDHSYEFDPSKGSIEAIGCELDIDAAHSDAEGLEKSVRFSLVYDDGSEIGNFSSGSESMDFPTDAETGDLYAKNMTFYRLVYKSSNSSVSDEWQVQTSLKLRINVASDCRCFKEGDYIRMQDLKYWNWTFRGFDELERFIRIESCDEEGRYISEPIEIFDGMIDILTPKEFPTNDIGFYDRPIINNPGNDLYLLDGKLSACMPNLDFVLGSSNRLWGCSNTLREIYASELGNARNWSTFEGIASDSYSVSVASPGDFTACINYLGSPIFFKEDEMIVMSGSRPSNFRLTSYSYRGVSKDSPAGVCVVNDVLYYKSHDGIYAYSGSRPVCVSADMSDMLGRVKGAVLSGEGELLFVSGKIEGACIHFTYDTRLKLWHRYSSPPTIAYLKYPDATLEFCENDGSIEVRTLYKGIPAGCTLCEKSEIISNWHFESGDIFYNTTDRKYVGRIKLDTECDGDSSLFISYDYGEFKKLRDFPPHRRGSCDITLFPRRCEHFRIRMEGKGSFTLFTMTKEIEEVSENG